jgi:hypothetical protein
MLYANQITKGFQTYSQPRTPANSSKFLVHEDPTYVGFQWRILSTADFTRGSGSYDLDYYPQGLFLADDDPDSAVNYFVRTSQITRAQMMREFRDGFLQILKKAPWYFTKITGLEEMWKLEAGNSFRGKDKKVVIETYEAIDLKMTYLMDLYRKCVFDSNWMRYALPENQRMFSMEVVVGEIRPLQISKEAYGQLGLDSAPSTNGYLLNNPGGEFKTYQALSGEYGEQSSLQNVFGPGFDQIALANDVQAGISTVGGILGSFDPGTAYPVVKAAWSPGTFISFVFDFCEFDIAESKPGYLADVGKTVGEAAKASLTIKTPRITENGTYGLLGATLKDSYYSFDYERDITDVNNPNILQGLGEGGAGQIDKLLSVQKRAFNAIAARLSAAAANAIGDVINEAVQGGVIGNVYGANPLRLLDAVGGFINNPVGSVIQATNNFGSPATQPIANAALGNVGFTGPELELIQRIIGIAVEDGVLGNSGLVVDSIGKTVEDDVLVNEKLVTTEKKNVNLTGPDIVKQSLGNIYRQ